MERSSQVVVVGAGAAGLWAAGVCAAAGAETLVLEKVPRAGTKILASGGSRCNLTTTLGPRQAAQLFGAEAARFLAPAFAALPPAQVRARFHALGVPTKTEEALEKVFPASDSARDVRDALLRNALSNGAEFLYKQGVQAIEQTDDGWSVTIPAGTVHCERLLLCSGGKSYPKAGTTGDGYAWLRKLKLPVIDPVPALVPLVSPAPWVHELTGLSVDSEARVHTFRRRRPALFTHVGLSGPGPMDLSEHVARSSGPVEFTLDLLPDQSHEQLRTLLIDAAGQRGAPRIGGLIPLQRRLLEAVCAQAGLEPNPRAFELSKKSRHRLIDSLKSLRIPVTGTTGFSRAEVTAGGLDLKSVDRKTMEVHGYPGLYVFGELLNLTGPIGGLNFQAAFATAELAARHASA